jgi:hypothetical protein
MSFCTVANAADLDEKAKRFDYNVYDLIQAFEYNVALVDLALGCLPPTEHLTEASIAAGNSITNLRFAKEAMLADGFNASNFADRFENAMEERVADGRLCHPQMEVARGIVDMARRIAIVGL